MSTEIETALQQYFGFNEFKPGQREVIEHLIAGRSAAAVFPTGGGKSLCYQLPGIMLSGVTLVVSPLIALMKDQIDALKARGIAARRLDSSLTADDYREVMEQLRHGELRLLYVAPERFSNERFREVMQRVSVSLFAVDEAHCISEWGHNFRPDYLKLAGYAKLCNAGCVLALTATATNKVLEDICRVFGIMPECAVRTGFYRPNLTLLTTPVEEHERDTRLLADIKARSPGPTIVYVTLQRTAEAVAQRLAEAGFSAQPYHAGLKDDKSAAVQDWFMRSELAVVVATIAFGMGVDKSNIRYVYHYNLPKSLENFSQEIGRAGLDGKPSICQMYVCAADLNALENFVYGDTPSFEAVLGLITGLFSQGRIFDVSLSELSYEYDIRPLVLRTLLTYLELDGYLEGGTPFYSSFQFKPLMTSKQILDHFKGERREFLTRLFRGAPKARTWFHIDADEAAMMAGSSRERVVLALDYLAEQKMLEVRSTGVRHRYRTLESPDDLNTLAQSLYRRMLDREAREIGRLQQVLDLAALDGCKVSALADHFGECIGRQCGHCSWCLNGQSGVIPEKRSVTVVDEDTWQQAIALQHEHDQVLANPRALARFLCGVTSPKLSRSRLRAHHLFGILEDVPFKTVLARVSHQAD